MITANEARTLVEISAEVTELRLEKISEKIKAAANLGKNALVLDNAFPYDNFYKVHKSNYYPAALTEAQRLLKQNLEANGFSVAVIEEKHDGKGHYDTLDDDPKPFSTWHMSVRW